MTTETKRSDEDLEIDRAPIDQLRDVKAIESSQVDLSVQDDTNSNMPTEHTQQLPERRPRLMSQLDLEDPTFRYQDAAIYLQEGQNNDRFDTHPTQQTINWYLIAHSTLFYVLDLMAAILLLALGLTEKPASGVVPIDDKLFLPVPVHATLELLSLLVVTSGLAVKLKWQGPKHFFTHKRTLLKVIILTVVAVEAITVLVRRTNHVRVTRALRPLFLIDTHYCYGVRRVLRQIFLSLPPILDMLFLLLFIMLIFAMLGFYLFSDNEKDEYFSSFWRSFVSLFVLLTTANYPDVMMPAYSRSRWSIIYFGAYISVVLYFLMNLLLAVVYDTFTSIEKNKFRKLFLHKRHGVRHAYKLICSQNPPHWISLSHFVGLMTFYKPSSSLLEKFLVFKSLDINQRRQLSLDEFYQVYENSEMTWKKDADRDVHWLRCCRSCGCLHSIFKGIRWLVTRKQFEFVIYVIIILNGISFIVDTIVFSNTPQQERAAKRHEVKWYHIAFITIYAAEAFLKIIGLGLRKYFLSGWNAFDFIVTLLGFIGAVGPTSFSFVVCLRPVRLLLLFKLKQRYRDVLNTMGVLLPRMTRVALVIVLLYYSFGIIGIECFSGLPLRDCCKNTSVEANYKSDGYYYLNNFDDLLYSYVTLFELTVVNNWFIIMEGVVYVTSDWARIYFMLFYIVTMVVMTIIVAFVLEAFLFRIQYRKEHPTDEKEDMKIRKEITVTYEELLGLDEELVTHLQPGQPVKYVGKRPKTKMDLSVKMYKDEVKEWIKKERIIDMGETLDQIDILEDSPHVLSLNMTQNGHTSPVPAHMSRDGHVRQEPDVGAINAGADVEYTL